MVLRLASMNWKDFWVRCWFAFTITCSGAWFYRCFCHVTPMTQSSLVLCNGSAWSLVSKFGIVDLQNGSIDRTWHCIRSITWMCISKTYTYTYTLTMYHWHTEYAIRWMCLDAHTNWTVEIAVISRSFPVEKHILFILSASRYPCYINLMYLRMANVSRSHGSTARQTVYFALRLVFIHGTRSMHLSSPFINSAVPYMFHFHGYSGQ